MDTVGRNKKQIAEYIRNQLASDQIADQIGLKEFVDPFTGRENKKAKVGEKCVGKPFGAP